VASASNASEERGAVPGASLIGTTPSSRPLPEAGAEPGIEAARDELMAIELIASEEPIKSLPAPAAGLPEQFVRFGRISSWFVHGVSPQVYTCRPGRECDSVTQKNGVAVSLPEWKRAVKWCY
jgi:hypothetical protein